MKVVFPILVLGRLWVVGFHFLSRLVLLLFVLVNQIFLTSSWSICSVSSRRMAMLCHSKQRFGKFPRGVSSYSSSFPCSATALSVLASSSKQPQPLGEDLDSQDYNVEFSRVVKDIPLSIVIFYIQKYFQLPSNLPLPYQTAAAESSAISTDATTNTIFQTWLCPLYPNNSQMYVEVVGLRRTDEEVIPSMCMVAIKTKLSTRVPKDSHKQHQQPQQQKQQLSPLLLGTQKLILRALDMALDDLLTNSKTQELVLQQYLLDTQQQEQEQLQPTPSSTNRTETNTSRSSINTPETQQKQQQQRQDQLPSPPNDIISYYAQHKKKTLENTQSLTESLTTNDSNLNSDKAETQKYEKDIPSPSNNKGSKKEVVLDVEATYVTIPTPNNNNENESWRKEKSNQNNTTTYKTRMTTQGRHHKSKQKQSTTNSTKEYHNDEVVVATSSTPSSNMNNTLSFDQNPFLNITNVKELLQSQYDDDEDNDDENSSLVTPEELAKQVMEFGQRQKEEEEKNSVGFAKSAFTTAKELLKQAKKQHQLQPQPQSKLPFQNEEEFVDISKEEEEIRQLLETMEEKEELRKIFEAGQRMANNRLTLKNPRWEKQQQEVQQQQQQMQRRRTISKEEEEELQRLIQADKTVPRATANDILEEELAELQLRIQIDDDDVHDNDNDQPPNGKKLFDIFQGPPPKEYNDPAIDWPGSPTNNNPDLQQSEQQKLPASLKEAVAQANFASQMLLQLVKKEDGKFYRIGAKGEEEEVTLSQVKLLCKCVQEAVEVGLIPNPLKLLEEQSRLELLLNELSNSSDRFEDVVSGFKDLIVSENFVPLIRKRLNGMAQKEEEKVMEEMSTTDLITRHERDQENLSKLVNYAMILLKETQSLGAELEAMQLELIRSICEVAMDPRYATEEESVMALSDAVRDMRPLLDENFVAYLKYAIAEEEGRLRRRGLLEDMSQTSWLMVLKIIQGGVYAELAKSVQRHVDTIFYVLRMDTKVRRRRLLEFFVDDLPSLDVRPFRKVVDNIVGSLGTAVVQGGDSEMTRILGGMTKEILQLASDIKEVLPPERVAQKAKDADEWIKAQRQKISQLQEERRQRLRAKKAEKEVAMGVGNGSIDSRNVMDGDPFDEIGS